MALTSYLIVLYTMIGISVSISPRALRNLNNKINLLKTTFQRELSSQKTTFQREIGDLKFEVMDLKAELHIEKARASRLEEMLNVTDIDDKPDTSATKTTKHERKEPSLSPTESGEIQQHARDIKEIRDSIKRHDVAISENKNALQTVQDLQQKASVYQRLYRAFQGVKKRKHLALKEIEEVKKVDQTLAVDIANLAQTVESVSSKVENNTDNIAVLWNDVKYQEQVFKDALDEASTKIKYQTGNITLLKASLDDIVSGVKSFSTSATTLPQTKKSTLSAHEKCRQNIRAGGEAMAKLLYEGVTVKRGKDWIWGNQDSGGHGRIEKLSEDLKIDWTTVLWNNGDPVRYFYRMGYKGAYDLAIVEEEFDFSHCNASVPYCDTSLVEHVSYTTSVRDIKCGVYHGLTEWRIQFSTFQDSRGHGIVTQIQEDFERSWITVHWDNLGSNGYRMGRGGAYDLAIVEEKFDFSRCK